MIINVIIPSVTERERSEFPSSTWFQSAETRGAKPKRQVRAKKRFSGILLEVPFLVTCSSLPIKHWVSKTSIFLTPIISLRVFPYGSAGKKKKKICLQCGRPWFDPWVGKISWRGESYPLQYSGLENFMDCIVHGVAKSQTWLSIFYFTSLHLTWLCFV